jgi:hypothetical protein
MYAHTLQFRTWPPAFYAYRTCMYIVTHTHTHSPQCQTCPPGCYLLCTDVCMCYIYIYTHRYWHAYTHAYCSAGRAHQDSTRKGRVTAREKSTTSHAYHANHRATPMSIWPGKRARTHTHTHVTVKEKSTTSHAYHANHHATPMSICPGKHIYVYTCI